MTRSTAMLVGLVVVAIGLVGAKTADMAAGRSVEERLKDLEKVVIRDSAQPATTVLERLEVVEGRLKEMGKAGQDAARAEGKEDQALKKALEGMEKRVGELETRLKKLESKRG